MFDYSAPEHLLQDRIILVTGAQGCDHGIGRAAANKPLLQSLYSLA
ncbi:hypothetical protein [Marinobacterium aestuariivivens]|uniref:Uncharacterized protein n=1 Tax=Marinobacterium aestuariivivens TaxID=1698799 RepID=A0ABW1ZWP4_9GAMM